MYCTPNCVRLLCMLSLTFVFFIVELVVSRMTESLAMLSDSFHMLSDVIALIVALVAVCFSEKTRSTSKNTFGWVRAEVMGALVNAVFLTAFCFTIILEAIERFTHPHEIDNPRVVIGVGAAGLLVNLLGLCLFHGNTEGHGHTHSRGKNSLGIKKNQRSKIWQPEGSSANGQSGEETNNLMGKSHISPKHVNLRSKWHEPAMLHKDNLEVQMNCSSPYEGLELSHKSASQLNLRGVFLHVLADALGSFIVVINALIYTSLWEPCLPDEICVNPCIDSHCTDHQHVNATLVGILSNLTKTYAGPCWVLYLDPTLCFVMVGILLYTTYPLLKESALILMQIVPKQIDLDQLTKKLMNLDGVLGVHELHVWQLAGNRIIATAHLKCRDPSTYMDVAKLVKALFHNEGIHATTVQPEFPMVGSEFSGSLCELPCRTECIPKLCCGSTGRHASDRERKTRNGRDQALGIDLPQRSSEVWEPSSSTIRVVPRQDLVSIQRETESTL